MYLLPISCTGPCKRCGETFPSIARGLQLYIETHRPRGSKGVELPDMPRGSAGGPEHKQLVPSRVLTLDNGLEAVPCGGSCALPMLLTSLPLAAPPLLWICLKRRGGGERDEVPLP